MSEATTIFAASRGPWQVGCLRNGEPALQEVRFAPDASADERATSLAAALNDLGCDDQPVLLAIPSEWCLAASISTDDIGRGARHRAMTFRLEEHLPASAEDVVADFVEVRKGEALGVAVELEHVEPLIDALQTAGVVVAAVAPSAMLAAQRGAHEHSPLDAVLVASAGETPEAVTFDWIELHKSRPVCWRWYADDRDAVAQAIATLNDRRQGARLLSIAPPNARWSEQDVPEGVQLICEASGDARGEALLAAPGALDHTAPAWADFRRDQLALPEGHRSARGPMIAFMTAAAILLMLLTGVLYWRGEQYDQLAGEYRRRQAKVFRDATGQRPPIDVRGRMRSEYRKLAALGGESLSADTAADARPTSALVHLRNVLANLPGGIRFRITRLDIQPDGISVRGQAKRYAEAESIANALRDTGLYGVEMHESTMLRDANGVNFHFTASPATPKGGSG